MKIAKKIVALLLMALMSLQLFGCAVNIPVQGELSSADEATAIGLITNSKSRTLYVGDHEWLDFEIKVDYNYALKWSSENPEIATVDSNGRVDAIAPGKTKVVAKVEKASIEFDITVKEAKEETATISNAILANQITADQNKTNLEKNLYAITINVDTGCMTVYTYNNQGTYNVPVRAMICSVAKDSSIYEIINKDDSKENVFYYIKEHIGNSEGWKSKDGGSYYRYRTTFAVEGEENTLSITSCAYSKKSPSSLVTKDYNKLGTAYTKGDIRLSVSDAKWVFDNCPEGTQIGFVYDAESQDGLGVPEPIRISEDCDVQNWDPTDANEENPFRMKAPTFKGLEDIEMKSGDVCDLKSGVQVYDTCMNLVENAKFTVKEKILRDKIGDYVITYEYTDSLGRTGSANRVVHVVK